MKIEVENPKECFKCGQKIGFKKLKSGKWMPVNADYCNGKYMITVNVGNHKNSTVCHKCKKAKCKNCGKEFIFNKGYEEYCSEKCVKNYIIKLKNGDVNPSQCIGDYRRISDVVKETVNYLNRLIKNRKLNLIVERGFKIKWL